MAASFPAASSGTYTLTVSGIGDVALGGLVAANNIYDGRSTGTAWLVQQGDLGAIVAGGDIGSSTTPIVLIEDVDPLIPEDALVGTTIDVPHGDLRVLQGAGVSGVDIDVFNGKVGVDPCNHR
jgi:hypothetical protein